MTTIVMAITLEDYLKVTRSFLLPQYLFLLCLSIAMAILSFPALVFSGIWIAFPLALPFIWRSRYKRIWEKTPSIKSSRTIGFDEMGVHSKDDADNPVVTYWDKYIKFKETKHAFLLYLGPKIYHLVPKRFMNQEEQKELRQLAKVKIR